VVSLLGGRTGQIAGRDGVTEEDDGRDLLVLELGDDLGRSLGQDREIEDVALDERDAFGRRDVERGRVVVEVDDADLAGTIAAAGPNVPTSEPPRRLPSIVATLRSVGDQHIGTVVDGRALI